MESACTVSVAMRICLRLPVQRFGSVPCTGRLSTWFWKFAPVFPKFGTKDKNLQPAGSSRSSLSPLFYLLFFTLPISLNCLNMSRVVLSSPWKEKSNLKGNSVLNKIFKISFWIYWTALCWKINLTLLQVHFQPTFSCKFFSDLVGKKLVFLLRTPLLFKKYSCSYMRSNPIF